MTNNWQHSQKLRELEADWLQHTVHAWMKRSIPLELSANSDQTDKQMLPTHSEMVHYLCYLPFKVHSYNEGLPG